MSRWVLALGVAVLASSATGLAKDIPDEVQNLLAQQSYSAVVAPLTEFLEKDKKNYEGWTALGWAYYELDRFEDAAVAYEKSVKLKKKYWPGVHGYVRVLTELDRFEEAEKLVRKAIKDTKKEDQVQAMFYHDLGLLQLAQGMQDTTNIDAGLLDSAETDFYVAGAQAPDSCQFRISRAEIQIARKRYSMAISAYEEVLACSPDMAGVVHYKIARAYLYQRDFKHAIGAYGQSVEASPKARVWSELGDAWVLYSRTFPETDTTGLLEAYDAAIAAYTSAKTLAKDDCRVFEKVGKAEALMGRLPEAVVDFEAAIECGSRDPDLLFALGNVLIDLTRFREALDWYGKYRVYREENIVNEPWAKPDADFFANEALVLRIMADSAAAGPEKDTLFLECIASYERALELDSSRADIMDDLGIAYYTMENTEEAIRVFKLKIEMEPDAPNSWQNLGHAYLQKKDYDSVLWAMDRLIGIDSCNAKAFEIAGYVALYEMKSFSVARRWFNRQLACEPTNCDAKMSIGYSYLATNDTTQIKKCIPILKEAYECRLSRGDKRCGESFKQNALLVAQAYMGLRDLDQVARWADKVLACEPGHATAMELKTQAESEY